MANEETIAWIPSDEYIPNLPPSPQFLSLDDLSNWVQLFFQENGAAIVKRRCGPKRLVNGESIITHHTLICDRGHLRSTESVRVRRRRTQKVDCPFQLTAKTSQKLNGLWIYAVVNGTHNHGPSLDPSAHAVHRKRTPAQVALERSLIKHKSLPAREMTQIIKDASSSPCFFRQKDIYNDRQKLRKESLGGLTPTQAWIGYLERHGLKHLVKYDTHEPGKVEAVFWTYPWCEQMWKRFPHVLGMDNTYKTNRFKMYLFQVTGVTDQKSVAPFGFGLVNNEREEAFFWLCKQIDSFRVSLEINPPSVILTDKELALKNACFCVFPDAHQQLCAYHINANVRAKIYSRWCSGGDDDSDDASDEDEPAAHEEENEVASKAAAAQLEAEAIAFHEKLPAPPAPPPEPTKEAMFEDWKRVIFAPRECDFEEAWSAMKKTYSPQQNRILRYISREYMPWRLQWASCHIRKYRNFGQRVNSPVETAHKDLKTYLLTGTGDLLHLHTAILQMLERKERDYNQRAAEMMMKLREEYNGRAWLGALPIQIAYAAVDLLASQYRLVAAALVADRENPKLPPCEGVFWEQYGLPCSHYILRQLQAGQPLRKEATHPRWWLQKPLDLEEPLLLIRDPDVVVNLRGRPKRPINKKLTVPTSLSVAAVAKEGFRALTSTPTPTPQPSRPASTRKLKGSLRRSLSQAEVELRDQTQDPLQSDEPSTKRSKSHTNTRGRGTQGGRGRGGRGLAAVGRESVSSTPPETEDCITAASPAPPATAPL